MAVFRSGPSTFVEMFRRSDRVLRVRPAGRTRDERSTVRAARYSDAALPDLDLTLTPWPARTLVVDGHRVQLRHTPGPVGGAPALYVHGLGGDATNFTDLAALLAPWLDGVAVDLPGFGGSAPPLAGGYLPARQAAVLVRVIEEQGRGPVHLFGNSMGGVVSLIAAATRPDLVRSLVLISPAMPSLRPRMGPVGQMQCLVLPGATRMATRILERYTPEQRVDALLRSCFGNPLLVPAHRLTEAAEEVARRSELPWATPALVESVRGLALSYFARGERSLWSVAGRVTAPTLVVWGERDQLVDVALAPRTARAIPDSRLLVLPGVGHTAQLEDPVGVARAFLALREETDLSHPHAVTADWERLKR